MEQESSKVELPIVGNKRSDFGSPTLEFLSNTEATLHHFSPNLFLQFRYKITNKCLETILPIKSAIKELQGKLKTPIQGYMRIHRAWMIPVSFCTSNECFRRRP